MREASAPVTGHGWAGRASWPSPICGRPHPSAARARLISSASTPADAAASCTLTSPSRASLQSASSAPSACPASPPLRLPRLSCPPRLGPLLPSSHYGPSVAPRRAGLPAGTTGWYGNRHVSSRSVPHGEAYSDYQRAYKMCFRVTLKGCRRSHNALFREAPVAECAFPHLGKRRLTSRKSAFCPDGLTQKRILDSTPHAKAHSGGSEDPRVHLSVRTSCRMRFSVRCRLQTALFRDLRAAECAFP